MKKPLLEMTLEELWQLFPVELVAHNTEWSKWYAEEKAALAVLLGNAIHRIDHIGSTAIEGLLAKPIVDILLQVSDDSDPAQLKDALSGAGWLLMAEGSNYGDIDLNKGYTPDGFAEKVFHLHIRHRGDWDELRFRDYLVAHPEAASEYANLKRQLSVKYKYDRDAYTEAKTDFINKCVMEAKRL